METIVFALLPLLMMLIPLGIVVFIIVFVIKTVRRMDQRAEERLKLDKENAALQQQQMNEINNRISNIERMLKEID
ncbi:MULTISPECIES: hypothetical protein [Bacillaceae]|uniref:Phage shock protein B n=1 Tax=Evansella alkalicola TaxID=745819 RepID=A0ABS6JV46_9BACI|nr:MULTISPECIES: hypothetical protein [Bacillaceae]MBU9722419.1 hypothetical protein [Bacillus alkalicola]